MNPNNQQTTAGERAKGECAKKQGHQLREKGGETCKAICDRWEISGRDYLDGYINERAAVCLYSALLQGLHLAHSIHQVLQSL